MAPDTSRVLCKYYMHGACRHKNGECAFSHDTSNAPNFVCKFYLQGCCAYGDSCRYDHVRPSHAPGTSRPTPAFTPSTGASTATPCTTPPTANLSRVNPTSQGEINGGGAGGVNQWSAAPSAWAAAVSGAAAGSVTQEAEAQLAPTAAETQGGWQGEDEWQGGGEGAWQDEQGDGGTWQGQGKDEWQGEGGWQGEGSEGGDVGEWENQDGWQVHEGESEGHGDWPGPGEEREAADADATALPLSERAICSSMAAYGTCHAGPACKFVHGDLCEVCNRHVLHPHNAEDARDHATECRARHDRLLARLHSAEVECCICMEKVLSAANPGDRRFGLLACDHPFCLRCIRTWRTNTSADMNTAVRTCPVCRVTSHFITPSMVWPTTPEAKDQIVNGYKERLRDIDCQHFRKGDGSCPFGTSCFYRHQFKDGRLESRDVSLRTAVSGLGGVRVVQHGARLSDFLDAFGAIQIMVGRRSMRARRRVAMVREAEEDLETDPDTYHGS